MLQQIKLRQDMLLKLLIQENLYRPASYFSKKLKVSDKTIYNDIKELNSLMEINKCMIEKAPRKGLKLIGNRETIESYFNNLKHHDDGLINSYSPIARQIKIMKLLIIDGEKVSYETLSNMFLVSVTSIRKDLEDLKNNFKTLDARIKSDNTGTFIEGNEADIQKALKKFVFNVLEKKLIQNKNLTYELIKESLQKIFPKNLIKNVMQIINDTVLINNPSMSDYYLNSLYVTTLILTVRAQSGKHLDEDKEFIFNDLKNMETYLIARKITDKIKDKLEIHFNEKDIEFLSSHLFAHGVKPKLNNHSENEKYSVVIKKIIREMSEILKVDLIDDNRLYNSLEFHIPQMIYRLETNIKVSNPLLNNIKEQYSVMFRLVWYVMATVEKDFKVSLDDDEISFLTIHFQVALDKKIKPKNILVVCPMGLSTSELIFNRIRRCIPSKDNIEISTVNQLYINDISNIDFIVSSTPLHDIEKPVIYVSPLVTDSELNNITKFYSNLNSDAKTLTKISKSEIANVFEYMDERFMFWNKSFSSKEECLDFLISKYEEDGVVTKEFRNSIYEREMLGTTSFYTGVAMPHALPETVNKTLISILTLDRKINWGENNIDMIIMIAIPEEDISSVKPVLDDVYKIVESKDVINSLLSIRSNSELFNIIHEA